MHDLTLSSGTVQYDDLGPATGQPVVLLHGLLMDPSLWADVVPHLTTDFRCIVPLLPLGAHRIAWPDPQQLRLQAVADLVIELLDRLDLHEVTLVGSDTGGAIAQLVVATDPSRVARLALVSCDAYDNVPPGISGRTLVLTGRLSPALFGAFMQQLRLKPFRRLPLSFGWLTRNGDAATRRWIQPLLDDAEIRRDTVTLLRSITRDKQALLEALPALKRFDGPAAVIWAAEDKIMPPEHGRRLAADLPAAVLVEIPDSHTLVPLDQPERVAFALRDLLARPIAPRA